METDVIFTCCGFAVFCLIDVQTLSWDCASVALHHTQSARLHRCEIVQAFTCDERRCGTFWDEFTNDHISTNISTLWSLFIVWEHKGVMLHVVMMQRAEARSYLQYLFNILLYTLNLMSQLKNPVAILKAFLQMYRSWPFCLSERRKSDSIHCFISASHRALILQASWFTPQSFPDRTVLSLPVTQVMWTSISAALLQTWVLHQTPICFRQSERETLAGKGWERGSNKEP